MTHLAAAGAAAAGAAAAVAAASAGAVDSTTAVAVLAVDGCPKLSHGPHTPAPVVAMCEALQCQGRLVSHIVPEERVPQVADGLLCIF